MIDNEPLRELKRELSKELAQLQQEHQAFRKRVSLLANALIPGLGFVVYGRSYFKGCILFASFFAYMLVVMPFVKPHSDLGGWILLCIPAIAIWAVSMVLVYGLEDN